ncbi:MAG: Asp23/Gls24 family envelope stress response protein [Anaerolineaceae bacterium]|nr:Asp23/Gls24 family envelope stress response protein [Anaerolineaceae bacterium]
MSERLSALGKTTIAPEVIVSVIRLNTLKVTGVSALAVIPTSVDRFFSRGIDDGVKISVENNVVNADIFVILHHDINVREVGKSIQHKVSRAISEMVGMEVGKINIHVEDIDFSADSSKK